MRLAALVLGIIGGIGGFVISFLVLMVGGFVVLISGGNGGPFGTEGAETMFGWGWAALPIALIGIIGGALATSKPKTAGIMMLISGIGGFIAISAGYVFGGPLLIIGGILALFSKKAKLTYT